MYKARFLYVDSNGDYVEGMSGGIFITNVSPTNSGITNLTYKSGVIGKNIVEHVDSDTNLLTVTVEWDGVAYDWNGSVTVNGVTVTNGSLISNSVRRFVGSAVIDITSEPNQYDIIAEHSSGAIAIVSGTKQGAGPTITDVIFTGGYPGTQTELKEDDLFSLLLTFDANGSYPSEVEILNFGAMKYSSQPVTLNTQYQVTITGTITDAGNTLQSLPARVRARNSFGTWGNYIDTNHDGSTVDGVNLVNLNNTHPTILFGNITYESGYDALKGSEKAYVDVTTYDTDFIQYSSQNGELGITSPNTNESSKEVYRLNGDYNVNIPNIMATAVRTANDAHTTEESVVYIANVLPYITITEDSPRFQKDSSGNNYTVTLSSDQLLRSIPTMNAPEGDLGLFQGSLPGTVFTSEITIYDDNTNGVYTWYNLSAENLSGMVQTAINTDGQNDDIYEIGGFTERDIYFDPQAIKMPIGTAVSDVTKLYALDKDLLPMTFYTDLDDHIKGYSIVTASGVYDPHGDWLYWNDVTERESNTTGSSFIRIREDA